MVRNQEISQQTEGVEGRRENQEMSKKLPDTKKDHLMDRESLDSLASTK